MQLDAFDISIQVAISQAVHNYVAFTNSKESPLLYVNYVANEYSTGRYNEQAYSVGPYPGSIARYLIKYWLPSLNQSIINSTTGIQYIHTSRTSTSLRPRRGASRIAGPTIEDIEALVHKTIVERLPEHVTAYLDLQHWKEEL